MSVELPGTVAQRRVGAGGPQRIVVRHTARITTADVGFRLVGPDWMGRRGLSEALADAVAELRAVDAALSPHRRASLTSRLRRGEISADAYPPLAEIVGWCARMRQATDGWFDAWAVPGGFDPSGLLAGWALERAAARLRAAGITDYAVVSNGNLTVRGHGPTGRPWRVGIRHPLDPRRVVTTLELTGGAVATTGAGGRHGHVVDPHTGTPADHFAATTITGPDLTTADAYATALYAAGPAALSWFPTPTGERVLVSSGGLLPPIRREKHATADASPEDAPAAGKCRGGEAGGTQLTV